MHLYSLKFTSTYVSHHDQNLQKWLYLPSFDEIVDEILPIPQVPDHCVPDTLKFIEELALYKQLLT